MTDLRTAAQQALEFCEFLRREVLLNDWAEGQRQATEAALKAALAEPVQEPDPGKYHGWVLREVLFEKGEPVGHREPMQEPVQEPSKFLDVVTYTGTGVNCAALAEPETCTWQQDGDSDSGVYGTSCGHYFDITDGTPEDNKMAWCCYCGKKLAQSLITEDEDD